MGSTLPAIDLLILEDARVSYWGQGVERALELRLEQAQIREVSLRALGRLTATGSLNAQSWSVQGTFGPLSAGVNGVARLPLSIALSVAGADVNVAGHIDAPLSEPRPTLRISVQGRELADLFGASGVVTDPMGSYEFFADIAGQASEFKLQSIQATVAGVDVGGEAVIKLQDPQTPTIDFRRLELTWQGVHDGLPHAAQVDRLDVRLQTDIGRVEAGYAGRISGSSFPVQDGSGARTRPRTRLSISNSTRPSGTRAFILMRPSNPIQPGQREAQISGSPGQTSSCRPRRWVCTCRSRGGTIFPRISYAAQDHRLG